MNRANLQEIAFIRMKEAEVLHEAKCYVIRDWSEKNRYTKHTRGEAKDIIDAVNNQNEGVFRWIKEHW